MFKNSITISTEFVLPIIYKSSNKNSYSEIVYLHDKNSDGYGLKDRNRYLVDHSQYRIGINTFKSFKPKNDPRFDAIPYAFGIATNMNYTNLLFLDFDDVKEDKIENLARTLLIKNTNINEIDVIISSLNNYHIIIELDGFYNTMNSIQNIPGLCSGFYNINVTYREQILRVSKKFNSSTNEPVYWYKIKKDNNKISRYINFIETISQVEQQEETQEQKINLRG